jgi:hypothetical protein
VHLRCTGGQSRGDKPPNRLGSQSCSDSRVSRQNEGTFSFKSVFLAWGGFLFSGYAEGTLVDSVRQNLLSLQKSLADFGAVPYDLV